MLKRNEEMAAIKQKHANEIASLEGKVEVMQQEVDGLKSLVKCLLEQNNPGLDMEALAAKLGCILGGANNAPNVPSHEKV